MNQSVLIVGAGPTGMVLATELKRYGVEARVIEKEPEPIGYSKALAILPRSLEIFEHMGVIDKFFERGRRLRGINVHPDDGKHFYLDFEALDSPHNCIVTLPQNRTEDILREHCADLGVEIERGVECVGYRETGGGVVAQLKHPDGNVEDFECNWMVGCDGARSDVRKFAQIPYEGYDIENAFVFVDAKVTWDLPNDRTHPFFSRDGVVLVIPHPEAGLWRVVIDLPPGEKIEDNLDIETFQRRVDERTNTGAVLSEPEWKTGFQIRQRVASEYKRGRVLIAGDAAHCHSPVGGQGMNTGLQDAFNLAWKLAMVANGTGRVRLLDSYGQERHPVAVQVLDFTNKLTKVATMRGQVQPRIRKRLLDTINDYGFAQRHGGNLLGGLSLHYRSSPVVKEDGPRLRDAGFKLLGSVDPDGFGSWAGFRRGPRAGDRAPDAPVETGNGAKTTANLFYRLEHTLFLFEGASPTQAAPPVGVIRNLVKRIQPDYGELVKTVIVTGPDGDPSAYEDLGVDVVRDPGAPAHERFNAAEPSLYLIRPDHYVGYRASPPEPRKLRSYLDTVLA